MFCRGRRTQADVVNKVIRRHVGANMSRVGLRFRPGVLTVFAVIVLFHQSGLGQQACGHIGQQRISRKLRIIDSQRLALGAADGVAQDSFGQIPCEEKFVGALGLIGRDFEACPGGALGYKPKLLDPQFILNFGSAACLDEALSDGFSLGTSREEGNRNPVHSITALRLWGPGYPFFGNRSAFLGLAEHL